MTDRSFELDVLKILAYIPVSSPKPDTDGAENMKMSANSNKYHQTVMFMATMSLAVGHLVRGCLQ